MAAALHARSHRVFALMDTLAAAVSHLEMDIDSEDVELSAIGTTGGDAAADSCMTPAADMIEVDKENYQDLPVERGLRAANPKVVLRPPSS